MWAFTPLWVSLCVFRCAAWPNDLSHWTQSYGLSLLRVSMWIFRCATQPNVFLQTEQLCIFSSLWVSMWVFRCWALPNDLLHRHKHELFHCCGLPCDLSELLHNRITFDILNTCASCRRAFAILSRFWRGVRPLSTVVFVKLNDLKLSLSIAETFQAFNFVNRPLAIILFFN